MEETSPKILYRAIEIFKEKYGIKTPLDTDRLDKIIRQLKKESK